MSKSILWSDNKFFQPRKEILVNMLLSEIIFLKTRFERTRNKKEISYLKNGLDKLEFLLNNLKKNNSNMPKEDFDKIIMLIYHIFREITIKLE
ncbi:MAG: hypothetical protein ACFFC3_05120 [Candidatus Odinarchaeota archaeon]